MRICSWNDVYVKDSGVTTADLVGMYIANSRWLHSPVVEEFAILGGVCKRAWMMRPWRDVCEQCLLCRFWASECASGLRCRKFRNRQKRPFKIPANLVHDL